MERPCHGDRGKLQSSEASACDSMSLPPDLHRDPMLIDEMRQTRAQYRREPPPRLSIYWVPMTSMASTESGRIDRKRALDEMAVLLPSEASLLVRLVFRYVDSEVSRPVAHILKSLSGAPMRLGDLAEVEGLAQPTTTALVQQAERRGWVRRQPDPDDGRAVVISITAKGKAARRRLHRDIGALMHERTAGLSDEEVISAYEATKALATLIEALREPSGVE